MAKRFKETKPYGPDFQEEVEAPPAGAADERPKRTRDGVDDNNRSQTEIDIISAAEKIMHRSGFKGSKNIYEGAFDPILAALRKSLLLFGI